MATQPTRLTHPKQRGAQKTRHQTCAARPMRHYRLACFYSAFLAWILSAVDIFSRSKQKRANEGNGRPDS